MRSAVTILAGLLAGVLVAAGVLAAFVFVGPDPTGLRSTPGPSLAPSPVVIVSPSPSLAPSSSVVIASPTLAPGASPSSGGASPSASGAVPSGSADS